LLNARFVGNVGDTHLFPALNSLLSINYPFGKVTAYRKKAFLGQACHNYLFLEQSQATDLEKFYNIFEY